MTDLGDQPTTSDPLFEVSWSEDFAIRTNPPMFTEFLRDQIPALKFVNWRITDVAPGEVESVMPLNGPSTNEHFTHQGALIVLSADYTGGAALATLFLGWPVVGVHPVDSADSVSMWLLKAEMRYVRPSTGDLVVRARIDGARHGAIQRRFLQGKPVIEAITMQFMNGDQLVAEGTCTYYARKSTALRCDGAEPDKVNTLYALKLTSSAEMIAGVRARESGGLYNDPFAEVMAGQRGMAVATRFCERTPQLGDMIASRTRHLDELLLNFAANGGRHVVNIGVGWDMRPFRLPLPEGMTFYELDFPTTLEERAVRLEKHGIVDQPGVERVAVPIDLRTKKLQDALAGKLPATAPLLICWEGMTMYFQEDEVAEVLDGIKQLMIHPDSLLWMDIVDREPVVNPAAFPPSIQGFMRGMQVLGEPLTFGSDTPSEFIERAGLRCLDVATSDIFFPETSDPIFSIYQFCTVTGGRAKREYVPKTYRRRTLHPAEPAIPSPHINVANPQSDPVH